MEFLSTTVVFHTHRQYTSQLCLKFCDGTLCDTAFIITKCSYLEFQAVGISVELGHLCLICAICLRALSVAEVGYQSVYLSITAKILVACVATCLLSECTSLLQRLNKWFNGIVQ